MASSISFVSAIFTESTHDCVLQVNAKTVLLSERSLHRCENVFIQFYALAALAAHEVVVMPFLGMVVDELVTHFAFENTTGFFQERRSNHINPG